VCGITGFWKPIENDKWILKSSISKMSETLAHRGPDDIGIFVDEENGIAFGHRRLSILDLSALGHQPMVSASRRYVIVYNGEIYNFKQIREELAPWYTRWYGNSDTEVLLAAIDVWGLDATVQRSNGMFAFALWDTRDHVLWLCRDRLGIKPLYYARTKKGIVFGSELKAIRGYPYFEAEISKNALALYLRHGYIPAPYSIYENTWKLEPAHILRVSLDDLQKEKGSPNSYCYWNARELAESAQNNCFYGTETEAIEELDKLLRDSVKKRMASDVPLGAFLSGGIDSSMIVALMQAQSARSVKTFTIGSDIAGYNEAIYAKEVASYLDTEHTELHVSPEDAMEVVPLLPRLYDEPFSDSSQIPTFLVSRLTKQSVTVGLSGDGGDELFGGYNRYFMADEIWKKLARVPWCGRKVLAKLISSIPVELLNHRPAWLSSILNKYGRPGPAGDKLHKLAEVLSSETREKMYFTLVSVWKDPIRITGAAEEPPTALNDQSFWPEIINFVLYMMLNDLIGYLPDDILTKVDRASMGVSLEARVPFLDHRIVEFSWNLPISMKIRNGKGKWILRQLLNRYVPQELVARPKSGFAIPIDSWLRRPLRDWAESLLDEKCLREDGFFDPRLVREKWKEHLSEKRNWQYHLWNVLMFQLWLENERRYG
jgi:asparagine synthase (glutamine-hydrolysing)